VSECVTLEQKNILVHLADRTIDSVPVVLGVHRWLEKRRVNFSVA
jgi:hypothetical protein